MAMRSEKMLVMYKLWFVPPKPFYSIHVNYIYDAKVVKAARKKIEMRKKKEEEKKKGKKQEKKEEEEKDIHTYSHQMCPKTEEERHQFCPIGEQSWCKWQKDLATGSTTYKEERTIPHSFFHELWPHFETLSDETLLQRCEKGYSQYEVR